MKKKKISYLLLTVCIFIIEVLIALFVRDRFIRPYVGDMLVVVLIYTFLKIFFTEKPKLLPLYVFLFALLTEILQAVKIVELLGLADNRFFSILIGTTFDIKDIICYGAGCILCSFWEVWTMRKNNSSWNEKQRFQNGDQL